MSTETLYTRLGGYDAVAAVVSDLLPRLQQDPAFSHFWERRPDYTGRDMKTSHKGMRLSDGDWSTFMGHLHATLGAFNIPLPEREELVTFIESTKEDMVEA
jgi:hemoglobin